MLSFRASAGHSHLSLSGNPAQGPPSLSANWGECHHQLRGHTQHLCEGEGFWLAGSHHLPDAWVSTMSVGSHGGSIAAAREALLKCRFPVKGST